MPDVEIEAMGTVAEVLDPLDEQARVRVLRWAAERFDIASVTAVSSREGDDHAEPSLAEEVRPTYADVGDLVHAAGPETGLDYGLAVGYWIQVIEGKATWGGGDVNNVLKDLGHGLSNVTKTLNSLIGRRPALVMQTSKSGRSRQARKTYKLTAAGIAHVEQRLASHPSEEA
jgi:hypothetical protein